jgi:glycosyltransferase involved in cell wall biosynthesis
MLEHYKKYGTLLFPSYLESFAIPLIEAAHFGMNIIASNLEYARETIEGYEGVSFIDYKAKEKWAEAIIQIAERSSKRYKLISSDNNNSWNDFFELAKSLIK